MFVSLPLLSQPRILPSEPLPILVVEMVSKATREGTQEEAGRGKRCGAGVLQLPILSGGQRPP